MTKCLTLLLSPFLLHLLNLQAPSPQVLCNGEFAVKVVGIVASLLHQLANFMLHLLHASHFIVLVDVEHVPFVNFLRIAYPMFGQPSCDWMSVVLVNAGSIARRDLGQSGRPNGDIDKKDKGKGRDGTQHDVKVQRVLVLSPLVSRG